MKLKVAVLPVKLAVAITVPFFRSETEVIPVGEAPVSVRVRLLKVTLFPPGLVSWICWTVTPDAPGAWVEPFGGFEPCEACITVTTVGVEVTVTVDVGEFVGVEVGVSVAWGVGLKVQVFPNPSTQEVLVRVAVGVKVGVQVRVGAGESVGVKVGVKVGGIGG